MMSALGEVLIYNVLIPQANFRTKEQISSLWSRRYRAAEAGISIG